MHAGRSIEVRIVVERDVADVWDELRRLDRHVDWMHDAVAIRFLTERHDGVGARFECDTKVGPFSTTDVMEITAWEPERSMGVRHVGLVEGAGAFELVPIADDRTEVRWHERLRFPWRLGGPVGEIVARPILRRIWSRNLEGLRDRVERSA
jgi:hypothetical protein